MAWPKKKPENMQGRRFGRLVAVSIADYRLNNAIVWQCVCDCGNHKDARAASLKKGDVKSCGCLKAECKPPDTTVHGMSGYSGFKTWEGMHRRCSNPKDKDFALYGGRGIRVCEAWHDPTVFANDMGEKPNGCSLDRIDPNGDYCPENCRWATPAEQGANKRTNRMIEHDGQVLHMSEWCRRLSVKPSTVLNRLNSGMDPSLALTMPSRRQRRAT